MLVIALVWVAVLAALGTEVRTPVAVRAYFRGEIGKYVPGAVWALVGRAELLARAGVVRGVAYASTMLSLLVVYLAGALFALAMLPLALGSATRAVVLWILPVVVCGVVLLHPALWGRALQLATRDRTLSRPATWRRNGGLVACAVPAWVLIGTATWACARALHADIGYGRVLFATAAAWLGGFLAVPVPGGVGVREALFVLLAAPLPTATAATVAAGARLAFVLTDALGAAVASLPARRPPGR